MQIYRPLPHQAPEFTKISLFCASRQGTDPATAEA